MKKTIGSFLCFFIVSVLFYTPSAMAEWNFGLGTGPALLAIEGDAGANSTLAGGGVTLDLDLDADDMSDLTDSAFGLMGYATDGKWMIQLSGGQLNLEGDADAKNINARADVDLDITSAELTVAYAVYEGNGVKFNLVGGLRYTRHDWKTTMQIGGLSRKNKTDNDWVDGLVGVSLDVPFYEKWSWNTMLNAGFGGSEGTYTGKTGMTWRFYKGWSATLYGKYSAVEFEESSKGDSDWYLWDVDESTLGLAILYNW